MSTKQEDFTNRALAKLLKEQGLETDFEQRAGRKKMDVVAHVDGLRVVLEAETGFHRKSQAIKDADARLTQRLTTAVFAVCYPAGVTEETLRDANLTWTLRTRAGESVEAWSEGGVSQLAQAVQQTPGSLRGADVAAQQLSDALDVAVTRLLPAGREALAKALDLPATKGATSAGERYRVAAKRGMLVIATAMLFHHRVQAHLPAERPGEYDGDWPPSSAPACVEQEEVIAAHREAWKGILAVDYRPVFETGRTALAAIPADPDTGQAIRALAETVAGISEKTSGLRHDLLGRIFHRVLDTARYDGSFYTSTAAAVLLATLALREQDTDWADPNAIARLRICDPACGTGTLLMAAAERIRDLRNATGQLDHEAEELLGLHLVEDVLWGYDVNLTATHMAASTLGMLSPKTQFNRMNVHQTMMGVFDGVPYLGSIDFLTGQARLRTWPSIAQQVETAAEMAELPSPMDLVIMNPPFTRDSLRYDHFSKSDELAIKKREKEVLGGHQRLGTPLYAEGGASDVLVGEEAVRLAARLHSSGGPFAVLGERIVKAETGTLALVLPTVVPTAPGNHELRRYLAHRFHIDTIVSSHDPERIFFSENTSIGEVLLICRRWDGDGPKPPTRVVNLAKNPATPLEALDTAGRIEQADGQEEPPPRDFTVQRVDAERIERGDWSAVNFLSPFLVEAHQQLTEDNLGLVPVVPLSNLADVGPGGQRIRDAYIKSEMPTKSGRRALWHHKTDVTRSMAAQADVYIEPKAGKIHLADKYWEQRSQMLLPTKLRLNLARVAAVMLEEQVVGSLWTPCRPHAPELLKPLCLYLNSTPGLLTLMGVRDNRVPAYPSFSLDTLRDLPVPDLRALPEDRKAMLDSSFDQFWNIHLLPFPQMAKDDFRQQIDDVVAQALELDSEWLGRVRRELAREPSVTDQRTT